MGFGSVRGWWGVGVLTVLTVHIGSAVTGEAPASPPENEKSEENPGDESGGASSTSLPHQPQQIVRGVPVFHWKPVWLQVWWRSTLRSYPRVVASLNCLLISKSLYGMTSLTPTQVRLPGTVTQAEFARYANAGIPVVVSNVSGTC
jgi:hypothetical protein